LRKYTGSSQRSQRGYTIIEIDESNKIKISGYHASDLNKAIDIKQLPEKKSKENMLL